MKHTPFIAAGFIAAFVSPALAQETWNFANAYPATEYQSEAMQMFADLTRERTDGDLDITVHHGGSLFGNAEILQSTRDGLVQMGTQLMTNLGRENSLWELDGIPFFVTGYEDARALWEAQRAPLTAELENTGLHLLYAIPWPVQGFFFTEEVKSMSDIDGMPMRAYNPSTTRLAELMGAEPTTVQMTEAPQAFATGLVKAMNTAPTSGVVYSAWDFTDYYYKTDAWLPKQMVFVNSAAFNGLSAEQQTLLTEVAMEVEDWGWKRSQELVAEAEKTLADNGMTIVIPEGELAASFDEIGDTMLEEWMSGADEQAKAVVGAVTK